MFSRQFIATVLVLVMLVAVDASAAGRRRQRGAQNQPVPSAPQIDPTQKAILAALDDERKAKGFYSAVLAKYGQVMPFTRIVQAEGRHESALLSLSEKYNIKTPADEWASKKIEVPQTLAAAYQEAIKIEKENVAMYDGFLKTIQQEDVRSVMSQLRWASKERHLPAFERHASGGQGRGPGAAAQGGNGPGRGGCCPACCGAGGPGAQGRGAGMGAGQGGGPGPGWQGGRGAGRGPGGGGRGRGWHGGWDQ